MKKILLLSIVSFAFSAVFFSCSKDEDNHNVVDYKITQDEYNISSKDTTLQIVTDAPVSVEFMKVYDENGNNRETAWNSQHGNHFSSVDFYRDTLALKDITVIRSQKKPSLFNVSIGPNQSTLMRCCVITIGGHQYHSYEVYINQAAKEK